MDEEKGPLGIFPKGPIRKMLKERKLSISGMCHTLTYAEYNMLWALDRFAGMYARQFADLLWLARNHQERTLDIHRPPLLKSSIDEARQVLRGLWKKGMAEPEEVTLKTINEVKLVTPITKKEAFEARERWRITIAGSDCINPPRVVADCIKEGVLKEERETGKVTLMKAFRECWEKHE